MKTYVSEFKKPYSYEPKHNKRMHFVKYIYALACYLMLQMIVYQQLFAQDSGYEPTFLNPNAAELSKNDPSSVNVYSGQTNLSVPIWNEASKGVGLNLSLGYNSGGNKVEDIAFPNGGVIL